jgi:PAS domain S-box-containing protein
MNQALDSPGRSGQGPDIVVRASEGGVILYASATCRVLGYEPHELVGRFGLDLVHPDDRARFIENTSSVFESAEPPPPKARVHRFLCKDGSWAWLRGHPRKLPGAGHPSGELLNFLEPISPQAAAQALST